MPAKKPEQPKRRGPGPEAAKRITAAAKKRNPRYKAGNDKKGSGDVSHLPPVTPETRIRKTPICGANRTGRSSSGPGICCMPAGWGTEHPGVGACKLHGGATSTHNKAAVINHARQQAVIYGAPIEIDSDTAVLQELYRTAGHVEWLRQQVVELEDETKVLKLTTAGIKPNAIIELYQQERSHLLKVAKTAKDMGIAERQMQLMEDQGRLMAAALQRFMEDPELGLTPTQRIAARPVMRRSLEFIEAHVVAELPAASND